VPAASAVVLDAIGGKEAGQFLCAKLWAWVGDDCLKFPELLENVGQEVDDPVRFGIWYRFGNCKFGKMVYSQDHVPVPGSHRHWDNVDVQKLPWVLGVNGLQRCSHGSGWCPMSDTFVASPEVLEHGLSEFWPGEAGTECLEDDLPACMS
jgi:hypothetical protein